MWLVYPLFHHLTQVHLLSCIHLHQIICQYSQWLISTHHSNTTYRLHLVPLITTKFHTSNLHQWWCTTHSRSPLSCTNQCRVLFQCSMGLLFKHLINLHIKCHHLTTLRTRHLLHSRPSPSSPRWKSHPNPSLKSLLLSLQIWYAQYQYSNVSSTPLSLSFIET